MDGLHHQTELNFARVPRVAEKWGWFLSLGIVLLALGGLSLWFSIFTTLVTVGLLGSLLMIAGVAVLMHAVLTRRWSGFLLNFLLGVLYLVLGFLLLKNPLIAALSLTILMASFFIVSGVFRSIASLMIRFEHWGWFLASGLLTLLLGILIWLQWPLSGLFMLGVVVGVELLAVGWSLVVLALGARNMQHLRHV